MKGSWAVWPLTAHPEERLVRLVKWAVNCVSVGDCARWFRCASRPCPFLLFLGSALSFCINSVFMARFPFLLGILPVFGHLQKNS